MHSLLYYSSEIRRIADLHSFSSEVLDERELLKFKKNYFFMKDFDARGVLRGGRLSQTQLRCFNYYTAQTVGGFVGFSDLFPEIGSIYNRPRFLLNKLKTSSYFRRITAVINRKFLLKRGNILKNLVKRIVV